MIRCAPVCKKGDGRRKVPTPFRRSIGSVEDCAIAGIVLAAGLGTRMGCPKAEITIGGVRLLDRATDTLRAAGCAPVIAVVSAGVTCNAQTAVNPSPASGMRSSLELGLAAVPAFAVAAAVTLVDMPGVTPTAIAQVIDAWRPNRIAVGKAGEVRTHPIVMSPAMWTEALKQAEPDEGARRYLRLHGELIDEVSIDIVPADLDTPEDLARWTASQATG